MAEPQVQGELWARAAQALEKSVAPMPLDAFWDEIAGLGWAQSTQDPAVCGARLAERLSPESMAAFWARFRQLASQLQRALEVWQLQNEELLGLPPDLARALREHIIGLGEGAYAAALTGPWRAKHRADRDDYLEGFGRISEEGFKRYPEAQLQAVLNSPSK